MKVAKRSTSTSQSKFVRKKRTALAKKRAVAEYKPRTELGRKLQELQNRFVAEGGKTLSPKELEQYLIELRCG